MSGQAAHGYGAMFTLGLMARALDFFHLFSNSCDERVEGSNWSAPNCTNFIQDRYWKPDLTEEEARKWSRPLTANTLASNLRRQFGNCLES